jgi:hypothetical protein
MPTLLPRKMMHATSVISAFIQRPSPSDHRVGFSNSFTRLRLGSLALRPAILLFGNLRPRVTTAPLPHATGVYGQLLGRDFNPLDLLLLLRTIRSCEITYPIQVEIDPISTTHTDSRVSSARNISGINGDRVCRRLLAATRVTTTSGSSGCC